MPGMSDRDMDPGRVQVRPWPRGQPGPEDRLLDWRVLIEVKIVPGESRGLPRCRPPGSPEQPGPGPVPRRSAEDARLVGEVRSSSHGDEDREIGGPAGRPAHTRDGVCATRSVGADPAHANVAGCRVVDHYTRDRPPRAGQAIADPCGSSPGRADRCPVMPGRSPVGRVSLRLSHPR